MRLQVLRSLNTVQKRIQKELLGNPSKMNNIQNRKAVHKIENDMDFDKVVEEMA